MNTITLFDNNFLTEPSSLEVDDEQLRVVYELLYSDLQKSYTKLLNADDLLNQLCGIYGLEDESVCRKYFVDNFLPHYPEFYVFIQNMNASARVDVECSQKIFELENPGAIFNCSSIKSISNSLHNTRWSREMTFKEKQGGVAVLGKISELLLEKELVDLVSDDNHFYNSSNMPPQIKAYGDFVIMCQPNNLWLSVKSGFSRERLLASGYTNDVIGVGFFQDAAEFTNTARLRNFKKAGFLAIYVPSVPVTEDQIASGINTYDEVVKTYGGVDKLPQNINGTVLIRDLSNLHSDLKALTDKGIRERHLFDF